MRRTGPSPPRRLAAPGARLNLWLIALGLAFSLIDMARVYYIQLGRDLPRPWWIAFVSSAPFWAPLGLALLLFVKLARRFPLERGRWGRSLAVHLVVALLFAVVHPVVSGLLADVIGFYTAPEVLPPRFRDGSLLDFMEVMTVVHLRKFFGWHPHLLLLSYAATVAAASAGRYLEGERAAAAHAARLEASLAQARLEALRMQLNPHFLFNALNAASVLALKGESEKVVAMLARLSELLRLVLDSSAQVVRLVDEVAVLDRYLEVERVRFEDRLTVAVEVEPAVLDAEVPSLVLQPLAENAIRHGISRRPGPGRLEVRARAAGGRLEIELSDSGPGFSAAGGGLSRGVGLANTRERLAQLYGAEAALELGDAPDGGGVVRLLLPLRAFAGGEPRPDGPGAEGAGRGGPREEALDAEQVRS